MREVIFSKSSKVSARCIGSKKIVFGLCSPTERNEILIRNWIGIKKTSVRTNLFFFVAKLVFGYIIVLVDVVDCWWSASWGTQRIKQLLTLEVKNSIRSVTGLLEKRFLVNLKQNVLRQKKSTKVKSKCKKRNHLLSDKRNKNSSNDDGHRSDETDMRLEKGGSECTRAWLTHAGGCETVSNCLSFSLSLPPLSALLGAPTHCPHPLPWS